MVRLFESERIRVEIYGTVQASTRSKALLQYQILLKWPTRQKLIMVQNCLGSPSIIFFHRVLFRHDLEANSKATPSISFSLCQMSTKMIELYQMTRYISLFLKKHLGWTSDKVLLHVLLYLTLCFLGLN